LFGWDNMKITDDGQSVSQKLGDLILGVWDWFMGLFGWNIMKSAPADDGQTVFGKLGDLLVGVWDWFLGLFGVGAGHSAEMPADDGQTVMGKLLGLVTGVWTWFKGLFDFSSFGAGLASAAKLLFLPYVALMDLVGGIWDWFMGLFGWESAKITDDGQTLSGKLGDLLAGVWDWFAGLFSWGDDKKPTDDGQTVMGKLLGLVTGVWGWFKGLFGFGTGATTPADDGQTVFGKLGTLLAGVWTWFKGLFTWTSGPVSVESVTMTLATLIVGAWSWFKGLFGFSSPEDDADSAKGVGGFLNDLIGGVWGYFKKLFQFGSIGDVMKSYFNLLTFFPNIIKDAIAGVTSWLLGLFGFDAAAKTVANAQNFSLGDMVFNALESIFKWFTDLLDIDISSIAKMIPGAGALLSLLGDSKVDKEKEGMQRAGLMKSDEGTFDEDQIVDISKLQGMMKGMSLAGIKSMAMSMKAINESDITGKGEEIANWKIVQKTLLEGLKSARSGEELAAAQKETNELSGSGSGTTIIQDNSQTTSNSSQPMVLGNEPIAVQSTTQLE